MDHDARRLRRPCIQARCRFPMSVMRRICRRGRSQNHSQESMRFSSLDRPSEDPSTDFATSSLISSFSEEHGFCASFGELDPDRSWGSRSFGTGIASRWQNVRYVVTFPTRIGQIRLTAELDQGLSLEIFNANEAGGGGAYEGLNARCIGINCEQIVRSCL